MKEIILIRLRLKLSNFIPGNSFIYYKSYFLRKIYSTLIAVFSGWIIVALFDNPFYRHYWMLGAFVLLFIYFVSCGASKWRQTHLPIELNLILQSPFKSYKVYLMLLVEEFLWLLIHRNATPVFAFTVWCRSEKWNPVEVVGMFFAMLVFGFFLFVAANRIFGTFQVQKANRPLGFFSFTIYLLKVSLFYLLGYYFIYFLSIPYFLIRKEVSSLKRLLDETAWNQVLYQLEGTLLEKIEKILLIWNNILIYIDYLGENFYFISFTSVLLSLLIILVFHPSYFSMSPKYLYCSSDIFLYYIKLIEFLNKLFIKNFLIKKHILSIPFHRNWNRSGFFSSVLMSTEAGFYFGIFKALSDLVGSPDSRYTLAIVFSALFLIHQGFELRKNFPHIFLMNMELKKFLLYKMSDFPLWQLYLSKLNLMRLMLVIPFFFLTITNTILILKLNLTILSFSWLIVQISSLWISPVIQLYWSPYIQGKIETTEDQLLMAQTIPRKYLVVPLLYSLYLLLFIRFPDKWGWVVPLILSVYFSIGVLFSHFILGSVAKKGVRQLESSSFIS